MITNLQAGKKTLYIYVYKLINYRLFILEGCVLMTFNLDIARYNSITI